MKVIYRILTSFVGHILNLNMSIKTALSKGLCKSLLCSREGMTPKTSFATLDDQLPSMSGVHGLKDFLSSAHLHGSFDGRIYSLKHFHKCEFVHQRTQEDGHYRENP